MLLLTFVPTVRGQTKAGDVQFNRDIRPILSNACFACHGPDDEQREAEQRFDTREGIAALRASGVVVAGKPDESELIGRLLDEDPSTRMPPPDHPQQLSAEDIALLKRWVAQGAPWQRHWAFEPPDRGIRQPVPPSGHPIDHFIDAGLEQAGLQPVDRAEPHTLLRRLTLDLTGLPPTAEALERFTADPSDEALRREVDLLLASPQYGERMALYWLDLVRYADSVGYHKDSHQDVWLYRDYVIHAFNSNKPFDRFVVEQLAGDLLEGTPFERFEWQIASGFNRLNQTTSEGGAQAKEYLAKYAADRVRNTAAIFLGVTMGCAECHDHKYDPISTRDFYSFASFFADIQERGVAVPKPTKMPTFTELLRGQALERELAKLRNELAATSERSEAERAALVHRVAKLQEELTAAAQLPEDGGAATLITVSGEPRTMRILPRGNWLDESGPIVQPAVPAQLGQLSSDDRATRLELANWIVHPDNPLTARVFVNRIWRLLMGEGICRTVDDVGSQGEWPSHPELLDWLAVEFQESGWNVKHLVKLIVTSRAYQRSSIPSDALTAADPENRLFARQHRFRLSAELVRDNALAISGLLSPKMYGRSVKPYQPANYWYRMYHQGKYQQDHGEDLYRRGLYTYWRRSFWHPSLALFDAPSREECVARRPRSNTPQQALVLLNDPTYVEAARVFAERIIRDGGNDFASRLDWAYRRALSRSPEAWEIAALDKLYREQESQAKQDPNAAQELLRVGEHPVPDDIEIPEHAAWTAVARAILNLHETITRP